MDKQTKGKWCPGCDFEPFGDSPSVCSHCGHDFNATAVRQFSGRNSVAKLRVRHEASCRIATDDERAHWKETGDWPYSHRKRRGAK